MREIEFRAKTKNSGRWAYGDLVTNKYQSRQGIHIYEKSNVNCLSGYQFVRIDKKTIGQYTGLTDKNGTKIFEGDIVLIDEDERQLGTICWDNECAMFYIHYDNLYCTFDDYYGKELEVIGNIYDNPELLEVTE